MTGATASADGTWAELRRLAAQVARSADPPHAVTRHSVEEVERPAWLGLVIRTERVTRTETLFRYWVLKKAETHKLVERSPNGLRSEETRGWVLYLRDDGELLVDHWDDNGRAMCDISKAQPAPDALLADADGEPHWQFHDREMADGSSDSSAFARFRVREGTAPGSGLREMLLALRAPGPGDMAQSAVPQPMEVRAPPPPEIDYYQKIQEDVNAFVVAMAQRGNPGLRETADDLQLATGNATRHQLRSNSGYWSSCRSWAEERFAVTPEGSWEYLSFEVHNARDGEYTTNIRVRNGEYSRSQQHHTERAWRFGHQWMQRYRAVEMAQDLIRASRSSPSRCGLDSAVTSRNGNGEGTCIPGIGPTERDAASGVG